MVDSSLGRTTQVNPQPPHSGAHAPRVQPLAVSCCLLSSVILVPCLASLVHLKKRQTDPRHRVLTCSNALKNYFSDLQNLHHPPGYFPFPNAQLPCQTHERITILSPCLHLQNAILNCSRSRMYWS